MIHRTSLFIPGRALAALVIVIGLSSATAACGGDDEGGPAAGAGDETSDVQVAKPIPESGRTAISAGVRYVTRVFEPKLSLELPEGSWRTELPQSKEVFALRLLHPPPTRLAVIAFEHIEKVFDHVKGGSQPAEAVTAPVDFAGWLITNPNLDTSQPIAVDVGGISGVKIDVTVKAIPAKLAGECERPCLSVFVIRDVERDQEVPIAYDRDNKVRFVVLELEGGTLVIEIFTDPKSRFDAVMGEMQKVLDSLEFE